jgi:hypothetical protein
MIACKVVSELAKVTKAVNWLDGAFCKIIESGKGYDWSSTLDDIIGARPFVRNTRNELKNGKAKGYLKQGLIARGLKVI